MKVKENLETEEQYSWLRLCCITYLVNFDPVIKWHYQDVRNPA